jgi:hypothetical protein
MRACRGHSSGCCSHCERRRSNTFRDDSNLRDEDMVGVLLRLLRHLRHVSDSVGHYSVCNDNVIIIIIII